jgi:adenylate cyclase
LSLEPSRFQFSSFRARILTFVIGGLLLVQGAVLLAVHATNLRGARRHVDEALRLTAAAFERSLAARDQILVEKAHLLSSDFAFKQVAATRDAATIRSALENHSARVGAQLMMLLEPAGAPIAVTPPLANAGGDALRALIARAEANEFGEASAIQIIGDTPYQLAIVPLFTPEPSAWIAIGFSVDDALARELQAETGTQVTLLRSGEPWQAFASTLATDALRELEQRLPARVRAGSEIVSLTIAGDEFVSWVAPIDGAGGRLIAVLQRSLGDAMEPYLALRTTLLAILALGIGLSVLVSAVLAARVTRPVAQLARGARRIERGDYASPVVLAQRDELGALATSFNAMMKGLAERDRVRDLLGRVVAPQIAEELLSREITLGGEERRVSVLFADVRGFTGLAEREDPQRLVNVLNTFLTAVSTAVEDHGGVIEEYMGDGAKALFGAPVAHSDDARRAVLAGLALQAALPEINEQIAALGADPLAIGIGIHTGAVVAGRMGSLARLKYTVVGDSVNLAARLEGLSTRYGVAIIASGDTRDECPGLAFRELDRVRVSGREQAVAIYEPLGPAEAIDPALRDRTALHHEALASYRAADWPRAAAAFAKLAEREPDALLYRLFLDRIRELERDPPGAAWDGTFTHREK